MHSHKPTETPQAVETSVEVQHGIPAPQSPSFRHGSPNPRFPGMTSAQAATALRQVQD
jgi:hypothetical protein